MGYGFGGLLVVVGLIFALAVQDKVIDGVDVTVVGWIMAGVGAVLLALTAFTLNRRHTARTTTTYRDGSQASQERSSD